MGAGDNGEDAMTDDLVKRLRRVGEGAYVGAVSEDRKAAQEAADRIEKLETLVEQLRDDNSSLIDSFDKDFLRQGDRIEKLEAVLEVATMKRIINTDRIEKLEANEAEWQTICDSYAAENQRFSDRIEKLEAALRDIIDERGICGHCGQLATGEGKRSFVICDKTVLGFKGPCHWTPQDPKDVAREALEGKDD